MSFTVNERLSTPVVQDLTLEVDGEVVATAYPLESNGAWRLVFDGGEAFATARNEEYARSVLTWLGDKISPLIQIAGPDELDQASVGSLWQSEYPANQSGGSIRNQYRLTDDGWEWRGGLSSAGWMSCLGVNGDGPYQAAYPLRPVSE